MTSDMNTGLELWQRRVGVAGVLLMLPAMRIVSGCGHILHDYARSLQLDSAIVPLSPVVVFLGRACDMAWYLFAMIAVMAYIFWFSRTAKRVLWFNAIATILFTVTVWGAMSVTAEQQRIVRQGLRAKN
jgi:hypothetical protein